jgi:REP element-mobilizing transposase RayT
MPFWRNYVHLVWTTKHRQLLITEVIEARLYAQMVNKAAEMDCYVHAINGTADHVHLVLAIPPKHSVAEVVKMLKGASSHFVNQVLRPAEFNFQWQRGYGSFSLGHSQLPHAIAYVESQKEHHAQQTTNAWLEKSSELDEGPVAEKTILTSSNILREKIVLYDVLGELPF